MRKGVIIPSPASCTMPSVQTSVNIQSSAQEDKQSAPRLHRRGGATAWIVYVQPGPLPAAQDGDENFPPIDRATTGVGGGRQVPGHRRPAH